MEPKIRLRYQFNLSEKTKVALYPSGLSFRRYESPADAIDEKKPKLVFTLPLYNFKCLVDEIPRLTKTGDSCEGLTGPTLVYLADGYYVSKTEKFLVFHAGEKKGGKKANQFALNNAQFLKLIANINTISLYIPELTQLNLCTHSLEESCMVCIPKRPVLEAAAAANTTDAATTAAVDDGNDRRMNTLYRPPLHLASQEFDICP